MYSVTSIFRKLRRDDNGAAMIIALLLAVILLAVMAMTAAVTMSATQKSAETKDNIYFSQAADAAIANALMKANESGDADFFKNHVCNSPFPPAPVYPETEVDDPCEEDFMVEETGVTVKSRWYISDEQKRDDQGRKIFLLYAAGYRDDVINDSNVATVRVVLENIDTERMGFEEDGTLIYKDKTFDGIAERGFVGSEFISVQNGAESGFRDYDSSLGNPGNIASATKAVISTNGHFSSPYGTAEERDTKRAAQQVRLYSTPAGSSAHDESIQRCYGYEPGDSLCAAVQVEPFIPTYELNAFEDRKTKACAGVTPINWVSSTKGTVLKPNSLDHDALCLSSLTIDKNTTINSEFNADRPLTVYVNGDVTVKSGSSLIPDGKTSTSGVPKPPGALRIIAPTAAKVSVGVDESSRVHAQILAPKAQCKVGGSEAAGGSLYLGSMACNSIVLGANTMMGAEIDSEITDPVLTWRTTTYKNVSYDEAHNIWKDGAPSTE